MAKAHVNIGLVLAQKGDLDGAKEHYEKAIEIQEAIYGPDFNHLDVARAHVNLGLVLAQKGDLNGAKEHYERALKICQNRLIENHPLTLKVRKYLELLGRQPRNSSD